MDSNKVEEFTDFVFGYNDFLSDVCSCVPFYVPSPYNDNIYKAYMRGEISITDIIKMVKKNNGIYDCESFHKILNRKKKINLLLKK